MGLIGREEAGNKQRRNVLRLEKRGFEARTARITDFLFIMYVYPSSCNSAPRSGYGRINVDNLFSRLSEKSSPPSMTFVGYGSKLFALVISCLLYK